MTSLKRPANVQYMQSPLTNVMQILVLHQPNIGFAERPQAGMFAFLPEEKLKNSLAYFKRLT